MTDTLKNLTETTYDSIEGYRKAAEKADSPALKNALSQRREKREQTLSTLNAELSRQGSSPITSGTTQGAVHRLWADITDMFERGDEAAAERVEEGEDHLLGEFKDALDGQDLAPGEREIVQTCYNEISEGERFGDMIEKRYD